MAQIATTEAGRSFRLLDAKPVLAVWVLLSMLFGVLWAIGIRPNGDVDDLLKVVELRHLLDTGDVFDRTLPGVLQPEPFVSHWPWLVDLPYALVAWLFSPLVSAESALAAATFMTPLLLLAPTLFLMWKIAGTLGFDRPEAVFLLCVLVSLRTLAEFQPGRIDYHNLQMLLLVASVYLTLDESRAAAALNGAVTALALAIGLELALFFSLVLAIRAFEFVMRSPDADRRLAIFGYTMAASAALLFAASTEPSNYSFPLYDRYSSPHALALVAAGVTFVVLPWLVRGGAGAVVRATLLFLGASVSLAALLAIFPDSLKGPYAALSPYLRDNWLANISQEKTMFERPNFVLSTVLVYTTLVFVGALATGAAALVRRDRKLVILALFAFLATIHALLYFRYFRFLPLFAGPGLALAVGSVASPRWSAHFARTRCRAGPRWLWVPGLALSGALIVFHVVAPRAEPGHSAADIASTCRLDDVRTYAWPKGSRVLSPPLIGIHLLGQAEAAVIAIPFHTADKGIERAHRFLDPQTTDPRLYADQSQATHVAVCAWRGEPLRNLDKAYPLAAALMQGRPPAWLTECRTGPQDILRIYTFSAMCPTLALD